MTATEKTRGVIEARVVGYTPDINVREWEIKNIERVMEDAEAEANRLHSGPGEEAYWARIQYYKTELLTRFSPTLRPRLSAVYHQYVAACKRGGSGGRAWTVDKSGCIDQVAVI